MGEDERGVQKLVGRRVQKLKGQSFHVVSVTVEAQQDLLKSVSSGGVTVQCLVLNHALCSEILQRNCSSTV